MECRILVQKTFRFCTICSTQGSYALRSAALLRSARAGCTDCIVSRRNYLTGCERSQSLSRSYFFCLLLTTRQQALLIPFDVVKECSPRTAFVCIQLMPTDLLLL